MVLNIFVSWISVKYYFALTKLCLPDQDRYEYNPYMYFSEYIFFTSGYWTVLFVQQITYLFVVHANYFAIRNLREYFSDTLQNPSTLRARDLMFWTTRVNLLWSVGRESFILGAMSRYLSTLLSVMHIFT